MQYQHGSEWQHPKDPCTECKCTVSYRLWAVVHNNNNSLVFLFLIWLCTCLLTTLLTPRRDEFCVHPKSVTFLVKIPHLFQGCAALSVMVSLTWHIVCRYVYTTHGLHFCLLCFGVSASFDAQSWVSKVSSMRSPLVTLTYYTINTIAFQIEMRIKPRVWEPNSYSLVLLRLELTSFG